MVFVLLVLNVACTSCMFFRSYYQPWKNLSAELSDLEKLEELHACQGLLVLFSTVLRRKSFDFHFLSIQDVENSGVFKWERSLLEVE